MNPKTYAFYCVHEVYLVLSTMPTRKGSEVWSIAHVQCICSGASLGTDQELPSVPPEPQSVVRLGARACFPLQN